MIVMCNDNDSNNVILIILIMCNDNIINNINIIILMCQY